MSRRFVTERVREYATKYELKMLGSDRTARERWCQGAGLPPGETTALLRATELREMVRRAAAAPGRHRTADNLMARLETFLGGRVERKRVTQDEIFAAEERSGGFGLYGHAVRTPRFWKSYSRAAAVDAAVIEVAAGLRWSRERVHEFMDSRDGRHCGDSISGTDGSEDAIYGVVRSYAVAFDLYMKEKPKPKTRRRK